MLLCAVLCTCIGSSTLFSTYILLIKDIPTVLVLQLSSYTYPKLAKFHNSYLIITFCSLPTALLDSPLAKKEEQKMCLSAP